MSDENNCQPILKGQRVILRSPLEKDKQDRFGYGRDTEFRKMVGGDSRTLPPLMEEEVERWYQQISSECYHWIIEAEGHCIGTARLHGLEKSDRRVKYAIGIFGSQFRGLGLGTEATRLVLSYAFFMLHLHRVELRVLTFNHRAIACYEKCGFVREGVEREGAWIGGEWQSDLIMSILEHEYSERDHEASLGAA